MERQQFPIFYTHPELIYFDSAATSQKPEAMLQALIEFYSQYNANVHRGIYDLSEQATLVYENSRSRIADFIGAQTAEIIFTSGTTAGINLLADYYFGPRLHPTDVIIATEMEHHSNFLPWQRLAKLLGAKLILIPVTQDYKLDWEYFLSTLEREQQNVKVLALTMMSNVTGTITPVKHMIAKLKEHSPEAVSVVDAAQYLPHYPVNVKDLDCDFLAASGHKIYGPTGIGFLYGKEQVIVNSEPFLVGGGMVAKVERNNATWSESPFRFEAGTPNIAGAVGLAAAISYLDSLGWDKISKHEQQLSTKILEILKNLPELKLLGAADLKDRGPVFSFHAPKIHPHDLSQKLNQYNIAVRAGHHCCQLLHREVLGITSSVRVSFGIYNEEGEITKLETALKKILSSW